MRRRDFIAGLGGAAAWPLAVHAQPVLPVIGYIGNGSPDSDAYRVRAFREGLGETGYVEGRITRFFEFPKNLGDQLGSQ